MTSSYQALTRGEKARFDTLLAGMVTTSEMAELLNLVWHDLMLAEATPRMWDYRARQGEKQMPEPTSRFGKHKRGLWPGWVIVEWYGKANGLEIPQWAKTRVRKAKKGEL